MVRVYTDLHSHQWFQATIHPCTLHPTTTLNIYNLSESTRVHPGALGWLSDNILECREMCPTNMLFCSMFTHYVQQRTTQLIL